MNSSLYPLVIGLVALALATAAGLWLRKRDGLIRESTPQDSNELVSLLTEVGFTAKGPAVVHFSATWCAPCRAVRINAEKVVGDLAGAPFAPQDIEVDIDENPRLASYLKVLSLPTTVIVDRDGGQRFRAAGVPSVADLRTALEPLTS